jgi:hypothetical protein
MSKAKKKAVKKSATKAAASSDVLVNFKMSRADKKRAQALANKHTDGNLSLWLRLAATGRKPER